MKIKIFTTLVVMTLAHQTWAQTTFGDMGCVEWLKEPVSNKRIWLTGFVSGLNIDPRVNDALRKIQSTDQIYIWMNNYCSVNPLKNVSSGALSLMIELVKK